MNKIPQLLKAIHSNPQKISNLTFNSDEGQINFCYKNYPVTINHIYIPETKSLEYQLSFKEHSIDYFTYFPSLISHKSLFENLYSSLIKKNPNLSELEKIIYEDD